MATSPMTTPSTTTSTTTTEAPDVDRPNAVPIIPDSDEGKLWFNDRIYACCEFY